MLKRLKENKAITLIALVITIIVLLILAGVAISMLIGENGILNQAVKVKEETEKKSMQENIQLAVLASMSNTNYGIEEETLRNELKSYFGENGYTMEGNAENGWTVEVNENSYLIENTGNIIGKGTVEDIKESNKAVAINTIAEDTNGDKMVIPENFNIAKDSPTEVTKGIIIEDSDDNQYVWIPIFSKSETRDWGADYTNVKGKTENSTEYYDAIKIALERYTENYSDTNFTDSWYEDPKYGYYDESDKEKQNLIYYTNGNMTKGQYETLYHNMLRGVYKNGGFYIGRYEMGTKVITNIEEAEENARTKEKIEYKSGTDNKINQKPKIGNAPVSKANAVPYTFITQAQAQMLAQKLGNEADYSNVKTSIMFGVQWDAVCVFIEKYDTNNTAQKESDWLKNNSYSKLWGNYLNATYTMNRGFFNPVNDNNELTNWQKFTNTAKTASQMWLCTTGASDQNQSLNIYDLGGNTWEWTLAKANGNEKYSGYCATRGSSLHHVHFVSERYGSYQTGSYSYSSRLSFYIQ